MLYLESNFLVQGLHAYARVGKSWLLKRVSELTTTGIAPSSDLIVPES